MKAQDDEHKLLPECLLIEQRTMLGIDFIIATGIVQYFEYYLIPMPEPGFSAIFTGGWPLNGPLLFESLPYPFLITAPGLNGRNWYYSSGRYHLKVEFSKLWYSDG